ncbi:MAG: hypothetical protein EOS81_04275 [Mesorhizobium sp.]|nr:MAG: hypothetical protein EOS81_04275 [Mesorhizobium sp.]
MEKIHRQRDRPHSRRRRLSRHNALQSDKLRFVTSGQKRRVIPAIKRQMRRRSTIEPVIGRIKPGHRMGRNYLAGQKDDALNAIQAAVSYSFSPLLN